MKPWKLAVCLLAAALTARGAARFPALERSLETLQTKPGDRAAAEILFGEAKTNDSPAVMTRAMAVYALRAGAVGENPLCRNALRSLLTRFPKSEAVKELRAMGVSENSAPNVRQCFIRETAAFLEILRAGDACAEAYEAALAEPSMEKRLGKLRACLQTYPRADNREAVEGAAAAAEIAARRERQIAADRLRQVTQADESILSAIRQMVSKAAALQAVGKFLGEHPDSPVIGKAKLLQADLAAQAAAQRKQRLLWTWLTVLGCAAAAVAIAVWIVGFLRVNRPPTIEVREIVARKEPPPKI